MQTSQTIKHSLFDPTDQLEKICQEAEISYLGLFGSYARNEAKNDSDIDLLVDFDNSKSFFDLARLQFELQDFLKKKVDIVSRKNVKSSLKPYIEKDLITIYEKR